MMTRTGIARNWRLKAQRYQLKGTVCAECGEMAFPPRDPCPHCARLEDELHSATPDVEVLGYRIAYRHVADNKHLAPVVLALVKSEAGVQTVMLYNIEQVEVDMGLSLAFIARKLTEQEESEPLQRQYDQVETVLVPA